MPHFNIYGRIVIKETTFLARNQELVEKFIGERAKRSNSPKGEERITDISGFSHERLWPVAVRGP